MVRGAQHVAVLVDVLGRALVDVCACVGVWVLVRHARVRVPSGTGGHLNSGKPDGAAQARELARAILSYFCTFAESDGDAVRRSLDSIATVIFSLAGRNEAMKQLSDYNPRVVAAHLAVLCRGR